MKDEIRLICGEDGKWKEYNDEFDITIHCETEKDRDEAIRLLKRAERFGWRDVHKEMPEWDPDPLAEDCTIEVFVFTSDDELLTAFHVKDDPAEMWRLAGENEGFTITNVTYWMYQPDKPEAEGKA